MVVVQGKRNAGWVGSHPSGVSALCVALRAQAIGFWQSAHMRFSPGLPHAADLHVGQVNFARVGGFGVAGPFGDPLTCGPLPSGPGAAVKRPARQGQPPPGPPAGASQRGHHAPTCAHVLGVVVLA